MGWARNVFFCYDALEHFEPYKKNFKYFHDSFYFDSIQQADEFLNEINKIDEKYFRNKNRELFAQKLDILIQTYGIKKSVHFVYPFFSFQQSKSDEGPGMKDNIDFCYVMFCYVMLCITHNITTRKIFEHNT